jgi:hypothetical protein
LQAVWCERYVVPEAKLFCIPKARFILYFALLAVLLAVCVAFLRPLGGGGVSAIEPPELRSAPEPYVAVRSNYVTPDPPDVSIGSFRRPDNVPDYQILESYRSERNGARGATLTVDTRATKEVDLTLVARDLKARYADLDSVSVEFIDSKDFLNYRGGALIFNTAAGAYFQGFVYGPPNNKGYLVNAAEQ